MYYTLPKGPTYVTNHTSTTNNGLNQDFKSIESSLPVNSHNVSSSNFNSSNKVQTVSISKADLTKSLKMFEQKIKSSTSLLSSRANDEPNN